MSQASPPEISGANTLHASCSQDWCCRSRLFLSKSDPLQLPTSVINTQLAVSKHACPTHGRSDHLDSFRSTCEGRWCRRKRTAGTQIDHPPTPHQHSQASISSWQLEEGIRHHFVCCHWRLGDGHRRRGQRGNRDGAERAREICFQPTSAGKGSLAVHLENDDQHRSCAAHRLGETR